MSLKEIQSSIEKISMIMPGLKAGVQRAFVGKGSNATLKQVGTKAAIGAGIGAAGNVALGDKDQSIMERGLKGAVGGGLAGGLYGAGKQVNQTNKALQRVGNKPGLFKGKPTRYAEFRLN
jgi:hypothetical protein